MRTCPTCGGELVQFQQTCQNCNTSVTADGRKSTDVLSLVLGIVGIFLCCCLPVPIVAIVIAKIREQTHNTKAALICGIVGTVFGALYWIVYIGLFAAGILTEFMPGF